MGKDIELPNYRTLIPNSVFGRDNELPKKEGVEGFLDHLTGGGGSGTRVVIVRKYNVPTCDEVISLIREKASRLSMTPSINDTKPEDIMETLARMRRSEDFGIEESDSPKKDDFDEVTLALKEFPAKVIDEIRANDRDCINHLRKHYSGSVNNEGRRYLHISNGTISNRLLEENEVKKAIREHGVTLYDTLIAKKATDEWHCRVALHDGVLPERDELDYLLKRGVKDSDVLIVSGYKFEDYSGAAKIIRTAYDAIVSARGIDGVCDYSETAIKGVAKDAILSTARCVDHKEKLSGLIGGGGGGISLDDLKGLLGL